MIVCEFVVTFVTTVIRLIAAQPLDTALEGGKYEMTFNIGQPSEIIRFDGPNIYFMVALCNRADHYIFAL